MYWINNGPRSPEPLSPACKSSCLLRAQVVGGPRSQEEPSPGPSIASTPGRMLGAQCLPRPTTSQGCRGRVHLQGRSSGRALCMDHSHSAQVSLGLMGLCAPRAGTVPSGLHTSARQAPCRHGVHCWLLSPVVSTPLLEKSVRFCCKACTAVGRAGAGPPGGRGPHGTLQLWNSRP